MDDTDASLRQDIAAVEQLWTELQTKLDDANVAKHRGDDAQTESLFGEVTRLRDALHNAVMNRIAPCLFDLELESWHDRDALEDAKQGVLRYMAGKANAAHVLRLCNKLYFLSA